MITTELASTLTDLLAFDGKAELIAGRIVPMSPTGYRPGLIGGRIFRSIDDHVRATGIGIAFTDNVGFSVPELASGRQTFSPDAAYFAGRLPTDEMDFISGPPTLAIEVRSKGNYGPAAEIDLAAKRADYFEAGTLVAWDVDPIAKTVTIHRRDQSPITRRRGEIADAEPGLPGWTMTVDAIFES